MTDVDVEAVIDEGSCSNPECTVNHGGKCALGKELLDCKFYELTVVDELVRVESDTKTIPLPAGEALRADELEQILAEHPASMVVPLGLVKAGKTTLMCLIFDQVRTRREPQWAFTKSKTILGFARRSYYASYGSGRGSPTTPRTSRLTSGLHLHLGMRARDDSEAPIVFVDLSGEHVAALADGKVDPVIAEALKRADHVPIIVNGRDIANPDWRARAIYEARALLGVVEKQPMPAHVSVSVIVTKGDLLVGVDVEKVFDDLTRGTIAEQSPRFLTADRNSPAEDDAVPAVERGLGVAQLLAHIATSPAPRPDVTWPFTPPPAPSKMLGRAWGAK